MEKRIINEKEFLIQSVDSSVAVDSISLGMLEHNSIKGLLPFKHIVEEYGEYYRYSCSGYESLSDYLNGIRYRKDVMTLINSIIDAFEELKAYLLPLNGMVTDEHFIMVSENKCCFVYLPVVNNGCLGCLELIQQLLSRISYPVDEDYGYIFDLQNAFSRGEIKSVADLRKWLKIVTGELYAEYDENEYTMGSSSVNAGVNAEPVSSPYFDDSISDSFKGTSSANTDAGQTNEEPTNNKVNEVNNIFAEFGIPVSVPQNNKNSEKAAKKEQKDQKANKSGGFNLFGKKEKKPAPDMQQDEVVASNNIDIPKQMVINDLNRGNNTVLVNNNKSGGPKLVRDKNMFSYAISTNDCIIGSSSDATIGIIDNPAISRRHARIFVNNGDYYIEDMNSTNGTCVNGQVLVAGVPCLITDMSHIKISNETFTFSLN